MKENTALCNELIKIGNKIPFDSNARADNITFNDKEDLNFYKTLKGWFRLFCVGVESGDDAVLKHIEITKFR